VLELVADEPEPVAGLEMVAGGGLAVARRSSGQEAIVRVLDRRPGRDDPGREVEGDYAGCKP
jgi:hypothetical protein